MLLPFRLQHLFHSEIVLQRIGGRGIDHLAFVPASQVEAGLFPPVDEFRDGSLHSICSFGGLKLRHQLRLIEGRFVQMLQQLFVVVAQALLPEEFVVLLCYRILIDARLEEDWNARFALFAVAPHIPVSPLALVVSMLEHVSAIAANQPLLRNRRVAHAQSLALANQAGHVGAGIRDR